jgi:hypothetical protein
MLHTYRFQDVDIVRGHGQGNADEGSRGQEGGEELKRNLHLDALDSGKFPLRFPRKIFFRRTLFSSVPRPLAQGQRDLSETIQSKHSNIARLVQLIPRFRVVVHSRHSCGGKPKSLETQDAA